MTRFLRLGASAATVLILSALRPALGAAPTIPQYASEDIGGFSPLGINQFDDIYGVNSLWSPIGGLVDIGRLPDTGSRVDYPTSPIAMNAHGQITGYSEVLGPNPGAGRLFGVVHAFRWTPSADKTSGAMVDLGTLAPGAIQNTVATGINDRGQVVGYASSADYPFLPSHGFLWTPLSHDGVRGNVQMKDLGWLQPGAIDGSGRVYGMLGNALTIDDNGVFYNLGRPPQFQTSDTRMSVEGRTSQGDVYGEFYNSLGFAFYVWAPTPGAPVGVGRFFTGPFDTTASTTAIPASAVPRYARFVINPSGGHNSPRLYALDTYAGTLTPVALGSLQYTGSTQFPYSGAFDSYPYAFSTKGDVVGTCNAYSAEAHRGFVEQGGLMYDLNVLTPSVAAAGDTIVAAVAVNDTGKIVAFAAPTPVGSQASRVLPLDVSHVVLLTPTAPAPARPLTLASTAPQSPTQGDPDQYIGLTGTGFQLGAVVGFDGHQIDAKVYAESEIIAFLPSAKLTPGTHTFLVRNPDHTMATIPYVVLSRN